MLTPQKRPKLYFSFFNSSRTAARALLQLEIIFAWFLGGSYHTRNHFSTVLSSLPRRACRIRLERSCHMDMSV